MKGRPTTAPAVSKVKAIIDQVVDDSVAADRRAQKLLMGLLLKLEARGRPTDDPWDEEMDENDPELHDRTAAFLSERRADVPTYIDPSFSEQGRLAVMAGTESFGIPLTVIIGRDGKIRGLWPGYHRGDELDMRAVIDEALK